MKVRYPVHNHKDDDLAALTARQLLEKQLYCTTLSKFPGVCRESYDAALTENYRRLRQHELMRRFVPLARVVLWLKDTAAFLFDGPKHMFPSERDVL